MEDKFLKVDEEFWSMNKQIKEELDNVKSVIRDTIIDFHNYVFPKYVKNYKDYLWFVAERMSTLDPWQSNINYPMISSTVDTLFSNLFDFGYEFWIKELWLKNLCTKAFDYRWTWKKVFKEVSKEVLITGKWYVKDFLIKYESEDDFFWKKIKTKVKTPSMMFLSVFDVMYDRSKWLDESSYKIIRTFTTGESIRNKILPLLIASAKWKTEKEISTKLDKWLKEYKNQFWHRFSMYDYNPVKSLTATSQWYDSIKANKDFFNLPYALTHNDLVSGYSNTQTWTREDAKNYFLNENHSSYELVEYTTSDKRYIYINWNLVYFGRKWKDIWEIREATYNSIPWTWNAMWVADKQSWLQNINNTLWNAFIDNLKLVMWPMFKVTGNLPTGKNGKIDFAAFRAIRSNGWQNDIEKIQLWVTDFAPINFMDKVDIASQKDFALSNYLTWGQWSIERVQWGIDLKFNQYKARLTPITDSIDQMMANIARSWILIYLKFFTKEELDKLWVQVEDQYEVDSKTWVEKFKTITLNKIDIRDILDESNITFAYNSLDKVTKEAVRWNIVDNLQYFLQYSSDKLNMEEVALVMAWLDFNPMNLFKKEVKQETDTQNPMMEEILQPEIPQQEEQLTDESVINQLQNII